MHGEAGGPLIRESRHVATFPKLQKKSAALCDFWKERLSVSSAYQRTSISSLLARCLRKQFLRELTSGGYLWRATSFVAGSAT
jgi:hypothetical protein